MRLANGPRIAGAIGAAPQVLMDRRQVNFMRSYLKLMPMKLKCARAMCELVACRELDEKCGYTWNRSILCGARG